MTALEIIRQPINKEFEAYVDLFNTTLHHSEELQNNVFTAIKSHTGKRLRPTVAILIAKALGEVNENTLLASVALELLHTASLVHDDVVDNSNERRGNSSINATNGNKIAVLLGDYILSTSLLSIASTNNSKLVAIIAQLGRTLADGELLQLKKDTKLDVSYETYYNIIEKKTASLFEACCEIGAVTASNDSEKTLKARLFGQMIGNIFQIRDDIFDYLPSKNMGKPAAKDMREGKLTLPALYVLNLKGEGSEEFSLAKKVKNGSISDEEIQIFIDSIIKQNGIEFAKAQMKTYAEKAHSLADELTEKEEIRQSLHQLVDYFSERNL